MVNLYHYRATVNRVIDGDTFEALISLGFAVSITMKCRLYGINCPEMHGADKALGAQAKEYVRELIEGKRIWIQSVAWDKYGRAVVRAWLGDTEPKVEVSEQILAAGMAVRYVPGS